VFENKVLRKLFGHKQDEESLEWRTLHKQECFYLYTNCSPNLFG